LLQYIISKGRWIGGGDIKFGAFLGAAFGVPNIILILFLSYWIGSLISLVLILLNKKKLTSWIPFGVFLVLGAFITMLFGDSILQWYYGLI
jgi:prepilin signal peptidase PulO-like enzyme (type II secretory pathway)